MTHKLHHVFRSARLNSKILAELRGKLHNAIIPLIIICSACAAIGFLSLPAKNQVAAQIVSLAAFSLFFLYSASYTAVRYTDFPQLSAQFTIAWTCGVVLLLIYFSGGIPTSDASPFIVLPVCMSFCFLGFRGGLFWSCLSLIAFIYLGASWISGNKFPDLIQTDYEQYTQAAVWLLCMILFTCFLSGYEWMVAKSAEHRGTSTLNYTNTILDKDSFYNLLVDAINRADHHEELLLLITINQKEIDSEQLIEKSWQWLRTSDCIIRTSSHTYCLLIERVKHMSSSEFILQTIRSEFSTTNNSSTRFHEAIIHSAVYPDTAASVERMIDITSPYAGDGKFSMRRKKAFKK